MTAEAKGRDLFIVDNRTSGWTALRYLEEWCGIAKSFDIATGYFEIGALLALDGKWQPLEKIRILLGAEMTNRTLESILGTTYQGQFLKGFEEKEITDKGISIGRDPRFFVQCLNDPSKLQVNANSKEMLDKAFEAHSITPEDRAKISALFDVGKMQDAEIKHKCIEIRPYMSELFETWSKSAMQNFTLTSVGIAIGHANIKRLVGEFANLSIWIN